MLVVSVHLQVHVAINFWFIGERLTFRVIEAVGMQLLGTRRSRMRVKTLLDNEVVWRRPCNIELTGAFFLWRPVRANLH